MAETEDRLTSLPGVVFARGHFRSGKVVLQYKDGSVDDTAAVEAVSAAGFEVVGVGVVE